MKQKIKNKLLALAAIDIIRKGFAVVVLMLLSVIFGYALANKEETECEPCVVGFASMEDMMFLVRELRECKGFDRNFD